MSIVRDHLKRLLSCCIKSYRSNGRASTPTLNLQCRHLHAQYNQMYITVQLYEAVNKRENGTICIAIDFSLSLSQNS